MIFPETFELKTGFDRLRAQVAAHCTHLAGRTRLDQQGFSGDVSVVARRQNLTGELIASLGDFPRDEFSEVMEPLAKLAVEGSFLEAEEFAELRTALALFGTVLRFINARELPALRDRAFGLESFPTAIDRIDRVIENKGVRDTASEELSRLRREIRGAEGQAARRLQSILQTAKAQGIVEADAELSIRDGRAVIPVAAVNKRKLQGFIHDESATGRTYYVEPVEVVELNNRLRELEYAERREVVRVLQSLASELRPSVEEFATAADFLADIDMLRAKARWAAVHGAVKPILSVEGRLELRQARHPLLEQSLKSQGRQIVPLDLRLDGGRRILVISGPNAGGKSVCLKTAALLQYAFQCGFPVTATENSELPIFSRIFIDIGDGQSLGDDLSTYSSHLTSMKAMLAGASDSTFFLIDEFGSGTEPIIGGAIAEAILEQLRERGCYGIVTTHYANLKYYASSTEGVENGAMLFDVAAIRPLFKLEIGRPGSSFAIEIARKIGLPEQIIRTASESAGTEHVAIERQLREIARDRNYWAAKRDRIRVADRKVSELEEQYGESLRKIREERASILAAARSRASEMVEAANKQVENTIRTIRQAQADKELTRLARRELDEFKGSLEVRDDTAVTREMERIEARRKRRAERETKVSTAVEAVAKPLTVQVGAKVRMRGQELPGEVLSIKGKKAQVAFGQILTTVSLDSLEAISGGEYKRIVKPAVISADLSARKLRFSSHIDVRGLRPSEALEQVRELVDDALMVGVSEVQILHGKGTGALKEEIRKYLRTVPQVVSAADEHADRGGAGITIVRL